MEHKKLIVIAMLAFLAFVNGMAQGTITRRTNQGSGNGAQSSKIASKSRPSRTPIHSRPSTSQSSTATQPSQTGPSVQETMTADKWLALGYDYQAGKNGKQKDYEEAFACFRKASDMGNLEAMWRLALCYQDGEGCTANKSKAVLLLTEAANRGNARAQLHLGIHYYLGMGEGIPEDMRLLPRDYELAYYWFKKAAEQGENLAYPPLAGMLERGEGCSQNINMAKYWYQKAADNGNKAAKEALERLK